MMMLTIFLLRGWPGGHNLWWDVSSSDSETVVVARGTIQSGRCRVSVFDKAADLVLIHLPSGARVCPMHDTRAPTRRPPRCGHTICTEHGHDVRLSGLRAQESHVRQGSAEHGMSTLRNPVCGGCHHRGAFRDVSPGQQMHACPLVSDHNPRAPFTDGCQQGAVLH